MYPEREGRKETGRRKGGKEGQERGRERGKEKALLLRNESNPAMKTVAGLLFELPTNSQIKTRDLVVVVMMFGLMLAPLALTT